MKPTLLAVTGLSPAIVTETIWALATSDPPVIPACVEFITTITGAQRIEDELFTPLPDCCGLSVWEQLRNAIGAEDDQLIASTPRIIDITDTSSGRRQPLDDIRTPAENQAAAESIFSAVWEIVRDPERSLIASIAGGRKTMGALLHSAVSLIGRESDTINHVLVNSPFESLPGFYFPSQTSSPLLHPTTGAVHDPSDAQITLAEVPYVPLRNRLQELDQLPPSFLRLRDDLTERLRKDAERPVPIVIDYQNCRLIVDGQLHMGVRLRALVILHFILQSNLDNSTPIDQTSAADGINAWMSQQGLDPHHELPTLEPEDFRRELNHLRDRLKTCSWSPAKRTLQQAPFSLTVLTKAQAPSTSN